MEVLRADLDEAERLARAAQAALRRLPDPTLNAAAERLRGHVELLRGRAPRALRHYERAFSLFRELKNDQEAAVTVGPMLQALAYRNQFDRLFELAAWAREVFGQEEPFLCARLDANVANALVRLERHEEARHLYEGALRAMEAAGATHDAAIVRRNYAVCLMSLYRLEEAERLYREARDHAAANGAREVARGVDANLAYLYGRQGRLRESLALYADVLQESEEDLEAGTVWLDQVEFLAEAGLRTEGEESARRAGELFRRLGMPFDTAKAEATLGWLALAGGDEEEAGERYRAALTLSRRVPNRVWRAWLRLRLGQTEFRAGRTRAGLRRMEEAVSGLASENASERLGEALLTLAEAQTDAGRNEEARTNLERAEAEPGPVVRSVGAAWLHARLSASGEAWPSYSHALERFQTVRAGLGASALRQTFAEGREELFIQAFAAAPADEDRWRVAQLAKSQTLYELLQESGDEDPSTLSERETRERLQFVGNDLARAETDAHPDSARIARLRAERDRLERELMRGARQAEDRHASTASPSLGAIQADLPAGTTLVEYMERGDRLVALVLDGEGLRTVDLLPSAQLARLGATLRLHLSRDLEGQARSRTPELLEELGRTLLNPVLEERLPERLVLLPYGPIHGLPLHVCPGPDGPIASRCHVQYAPSASVWWSIGRRVGKARPTGAPLVFGFPDDKAPLMEEECRRVAEVLGVEPVISSPDGREQLARQCATARLLHIAAHASFRPDRPLFSALHFGADEVTAYDLARLRLGAELAVLSGCGTAMAGRTAGDELTGLVQALLVAGARNVLASFWPAHDETSLRFMSEMYRVLPRNGVEAAYRHTVRSLWNAGEPVARWGQFALIRGVL